MPHLFGTLADGREISVFTIKNSKGCSAEVLNYGGIIKSLKVPDKKGISTDVVLGFRSLEEYVADQTYMGAIVGRYANRIANARFELAGNICQLSANDKQNCLHGGFQGFNKKVWEVVSYQSNVFTLCYLSADGEEGFPGNLLVTVTYRITENDFHVIMQHGYWIGFRKIG